MKINRELEDLESLYFREVTNAKVHRGLLRPWRTNALGEYAKGWNDCIKLMDKRHREVLKLLKRQYETAKSEVAEMA